MASNVEEEAQAELPVARAEEDPIVDENACDSSPTFPLDVASPGADRLRSTVKTKLSEFMGSYTDDVLAEYVVVLVGHGKKRKQATADLEAFLGVQSEAFVSWLWEHLTANLNDYTQSSEPSQLLDSEKPQETCQKKEDALLAEKTDKETGPEERRPELKRSRSPEPWTRRRKLRTENKEQKVEGSPPKETPSESAPRLRASRRLLEFAVRDAVAPSGNSTARKVTTDAASKRLRSVVSTDEKPHPDTNGKLKPRPVVAKQTKSMPAMMVALKAAAAAAEDVSKKPSVKPVSRFKPSIWDRVGDKDDGLPDRQSLEDAEHEIMEKMEQVHVNKAPRNAKASERHIRRGGDADRRAPSDAAMHYTEDLGEQQFERRIEEVPESRKESKRHGIKKDRRQRKPEDYRRVDAEQKDIPLDRKTKSVDVENEKRMDLPNGKDQDSQDVTEMKKRMRQVEMEVTKLRTKQDEVVRVSEKAISASVTPPGNPPNAPAAAVKLPVEDADSRTVLVTNVHFATTKEAISAHFASCGDVAKATILSDASGKPKGSAYVEFSSKEGCDKALAMNESCLLSRPLRVVRKDANVVESSSTPVVRAPLIRPVRMPIRAFPRATAFMRASPYLLRPPPPRLVRPPFPVAPHLQWKRDSAGNQTTAMKNGFRSNVGPMRKRSLSYVRPVAPPTPPPEPPALTSSTEEQKVSG